MQQQKQYKTESKRKPSQMESCWGNGCIPRASGSSRMLVSHLADVLEIGKFPIAQDGCPNHLAHGATIIGVGDSEPCHGAPSPTAHPEAAPLAPLACSTRSCLWSTDCIMLLGAHPWWAASSPSCPCCVQWSGQVEWHHGPVSKSPGSACTYIHRWSRLFLCWWFPKGWRSSRPAHTLSWPKRCASLCPPPSSWSPCPSQSSHFPRWWGGVVDQDIPSAKESSSRSQRRWQLHPTQEPQLTGLDPNQMPEWPHRSSSTCDREVQHGQGQPLPTTTAPCCIAMPPSLPHRSWTAHRAPAWHRPPQRDEAPQRGRRSSHRTWLWTGAAAWNPPHLPQANPSQEPECG